MDIAKRWRLAMRRPTVGSSSEEASSQETRERKIVAAHSRGNIRLQRGEYVTQQELAHQVERAKVYDFGSG